MKNGNMGALAKCINGRAAKLGALLMLSAVSGCSGSFFDHTSPQVKATLTGIANRYLMSVAAGNEQAVNNMIYWPAFLGTGSDRITRADFDDQFRRCTELWKHTRSLTEHPLLGFKVKSVFADDNHAEIHLRKDERYQRQDRPFPDIEVQFIWEGTGWIIREDSIFGRDKYCDEQLSARRQAVP